MTVGESQEALFFMDGKALDLFGPGHYVLETKNIPLLGKAVNALYGGETPFHCSIYFINKVDQLSIKWGTDSKVEYLDPTYNFPLKVGMSGEMVLTVNDPRKLIIKLVGNERAYTQEKAVDNFKGLLLTKLKPFIAQYMVNNKVNIFDVDSHLQDFNNTLLNLMIPEYEEYGMELKKLYVTNVVKPEGDRQYEKFKEIHYRKYTDVASAKLQQELDIIAANTEAMKIGIEAQALASKRQTEGYTFQEEKSFEVAKEAAANEGVGQYTNVGIGLGLMQGVGNTIGSSIDSMINPTLSNNTANQNNDSEDPVQILNKLKQMLDQGLVSQEDYDKKKEEILGRM